MESWPSEESNKASVHAAVQAARGPSGDAVARFDVRGDTVRNGLRVSSDEVDLVVAAEVAEPHGLSVPGSVEVVRVEPAQPPSDADVRVAVAIPVERAENWPVAAGHVNAGQKALMHLPMARVDRCVVSCDRSLVIDLPDDIGRHEYGAIKVVDAESTVAPGPHS